MQQLTHILGCILLFLVSSPVVAQNDCSYELSGYVLDAHNKKPLPNSKVHIRELDITVTANSKGFYSIPGMCKGEYLVFCKHIGCDAIKDTIELTQSTVLNFYPEHHLEIGPVEVEANKDADLTQKPERMSERELNESRGLSLGEGLSKINGVSQLSAGNNISKPVIHGMHSNRILILNNGVRQEGQQWGNEHAPEIDPFIAGDLAVIKGANSVRYGPDAIAGVILVNPKELKKTPGISGELNLVGLSNGQQGNVSATVDGNLSKLPALRWRAQGTLKRGGNVHAPDYFLKNTGIFEYNFSGAVGWFKPNYGIDVFYSQFNTEIGVFSASHFGNLTDLQTAFEAERPLEEADFTYAINRPRQEIEHELFKAQGYLFTGDKGKLTFTYARQFNRRREFDKDVPLNDSLAALNLPALSFNLTTHTGEIAWQHNRVNNFKGSIGVSGIHQGNTYRGRFFIPNFRKLGGGVYWIEQWKPKGSKLALEAGARFDYIYQRIYMWVDEEIYSPEQHFMNGNGSFGASYAFNKKFSVRGNVGTAWRPPNVAELYSDGLHHGAAGIEIGNSALKTEQALNFTASLEYDSDRLRFLVDGYYNIVNNFIYLRPTLETLLTIKGAYPVFAYSQANAHLRGTDITVGYELTDNWNFTSKASILRAWNFSQNDHLIWMPADRFENSVEYRFNKNSKLTNAFISMTVVTVLEQTRVPENTDFAPPPEGYTILNASMGMDIPVKNQLITVGLTANNLLNARYRDYMNRFRYFTDVMGTNIALRVKVPFELVKAKSIHEIHN
ncbi:MAG: TonB-dependent receptor [bacterium]|nr:TonB-dependent receptor [bacterium]